MEIKPTSVCIRNLGLVSKYWVRIHHDADCAYSAILDTISIVYCTMHYFCLGSMDSKESGNVGKLFLIGQHRQRSTSKNVDAVKL